MSNQGKTDCSNVTSQSLQANGDISGIGVVIGFTGTAYFVLILCIGAYLVTFNPERNPFQLQDNPTWWKPNPIDVGFLRKFRRMIRLESWVKNVPHWEAVFDEAILNMCDVQVLTGLGILITGFATLDDELSAYHWRQITLLAWFSSITHLSGLTILRTYFYGHSWKRAIRLGLMFSLLVMLIVSLVPTGFFAWVHMDEYPVREYMASPALCYYRTQSKVYQTVTETHQQLVGQSVGQSGSMQAAIFSSVILVFGFFTRCIKLLRPVSELLNRKIRRPIRRFSRKALHRLAMIGKGRFSKTGHIMYTILVVRPSLAAFLCFRLLADIFSSILFEIYWLLASILWGTFRIVNARAELFVYAEDVWQEESRWTFGQILATLLLVGPLFVIMGLFLSGGQKSSVTRPSLEYVDEGCHPVPIPENDTHYPLGGLDEESLRGYSCDAPWLKPCLIVGFIDTIIVITFFIGFTFGWDITRGSGLTYQGVSDAYFGGTTLLNFWINSLGSLWFMLLGFPITLVITVGIGLSLKGWMDSSRGWLWKHLVFFVLIGLVHVLYFLGWLIGFPIDGPRDTAGIDFSLKVVGALFGINYGWYIFIALSAQYLLKG